MINKLLFNVVYFFFFNKPNRSDFFYKFSTFIPLLYIPKVNFKYKSLTDGKNILYFNHLNRLYLYSRSLLYRYKKLLAEYCVYPNTELKINKDDYIIDCGANIGEFSIAFSLQYDVKKFICFEPDPSEFKVLSKNISSKNCILINKALSNKNGLSDFYLDNTTGDSSLLINENVKHTTIETLTLDKFVSEAHIESIGFIKIEAEGFEPEILEGALNTLNIIKYISIDCGFERYGNSTFAQVSDFLIKHEFHLLDFNSNRHSMLFCNKRILSIK